MKLREELSKVNLGNKEEYARIFSKLVKQSKNNKLKFKVGVFDKGKYYLVNEENRGGSYFIHIVPKEVYPLFCKMQKEIPHSPLGFTVLAGKLNNKEVRISRFGVQCNLLGKSLF